MSENGEQQINGDGDGEEQSQAAMEGDTNENQSEAVEATNETEAGNEGEQAAGEEGEQAAGEEGEQAAGEESEQAAGEVEGGQAETADESQGQEAELGTEEQETASNQGEQGEQEENVAEAEKTEQEVQEEELEQNQDGEQDNADEDTQEVDKEEAVQENEEEEALQDEAQEEDGQTVAQEQSESNVAENQAKDEDADKGEEETTSEQTQQEKSGDEGDKEEQAESEQAQVSSVTEEQDEDKVDESATEGGQVQADETEEQDSAQAVTQDVDEGNEDQEVDKDQQQGEVDDAEGQEVAQEDAQEQNEDGDAQGVQDAGQVDQEDGEAAAVSAQQQEEQDAAGHTVEQEDGEAAAVSGQQQEATEDTVDQNVEIEKEEEQGAEGQEAEAGEAEAQQAASAEETGDQQTQEDKEEQQEATAESAEPQGEQAQAEEEKPQTEGEGTQEEIQQASVEQDPEIAAEAAAAPPPAPPHLPTPQHSDLSMEGQMSTSALNIVWSFGLNRNVPVLNLSDGVRQAIMYPCAHVGIMYDFKNNKQHILQAHLNPITCSAVSQDRRWLVTGDVGPDAMVNIWDTYTGTPIQTMFDPNPEGGVVAVAFTPDSRYLATLSALPVQTLAIWDWTVDGDVPVCSADLKPEYGVQNFIYFDTTDIHHVVTNSETQVLFYHWEEGMMQYYAPPLSDSDFNKPVGRYSQSVFQIGIARALTATSIGNLVVWDNNRPLSKIMDVNQSADKKPLKIIKVHDKGINVLTNTDNYIVIGDTAGHVKFFDQGLRLIYWYQDFNSGPCTSISFAHMPDFEPVARSHSKYPSDATKQAGPFVVRDFIVGTAIAIYCSINTDGSKMKVIHREHDAAVHALAAHPKLPIIAMGSYSGLLKLWHYRNKEAVASRMFEKCHIQTCAFDANGFFLAVGCTNGTVYLVDSVALLDQLNEPFKYARDAITHIAFSHNSTFMATADAGFTITVYKRVRKEGRNPYTWHGRYRSHYKPIRDLLFDVHLDSNEPKLLSLGEDRMLIEYDLHHVGKTNNHVVPCAEDRIEQGAIPQCMTNYPPITKEHFFLTANDQFKLKCYNSTTKMCRKTVLGPTYGSPIRKMMVVPTQGSVSQDRFLAFITDDKVGLHILPATGNPHLAMALIAHPSGISNLACSFDGSYLFTAGGPDFAVHMWEINIVALEAQAKLGGEDLVPFYGLLEGGRDGELFAELEDLFYYAQLRHQGINSTDDRRIGNKVPLSEVPYIMRAMGFYPSEQEIEDMLNEIKYDEYVTLGHYQEDIDLGRFIKLYVNHRPAFGLSPEKLLWAFQTLAESPHLGKGGVIERGDFLDLLQKNGEHMTEYELAEHLTTLLGFNKEGGACEEEEFEAEKAGNFIAENLPYDINAEILVNEILGFSMTVDPPEADDTRDVIKSTAQ